MIELIWDEGFKKKLKKIIKNNPIMKDRLFEKLDVFCTAPYDSRLKTHKLSGNLKDL